MLDDVKRLIEPCLESLEKKVENMLVPQLTLWISWNKKSLEASRLLGTTLGSLFILTVEERSKKGEKEG